MNPPGQTQLAKDCGGVGEKVLMVLESKAASFQTERRTTVKVRAFKETD